MRLLVLFLALFLCTASAPVNGYTDFKRIAVLHEGRIKPLDSFARHYARLFSGNERVNGQPAILWLARTLFEPGLAVEEKIFLIRNPQALGLDHKKKVLSYLDLGKALARKTDTISQLLEIPQDQWSADQSALIEYHDFALAYGDLIRSFTMILPLQIEPPAALGLGSKTFTYEQLQEHMGDIEKRAKNIIARKGDKIEQYSESEKEIIAFTYQINFLAQAGQRSRLLKIIPVGAQWQPPWQVDKTQLSEWVTLAHAWNEGDAAKWRDTAGRLASAADSAKIHAEVWYNQIHPLGLAMMLYLLAFFCAALHALWEKKHLKAAARNCLAVAVASNALAIGLRVFILERPPVGTLYESIIFVALIAAIGGWLFEQRDGSGRGLIAAAMAGSILLFVAEAFVTDDTMRVLVAVLNTNFWLATHVLCITIGYGWCVLTALFAHFYLIARARGQAMTGDLIRTTKLLALIALLFTTVGTILGGIWADQSWGRFWGWDPKENGALLIVLWLAWCLHGSIAGQLKPLALMAGFAALNIIVALAWFGVNLLGTGLHSYGFIEGVAVSLFTFCLAEILIIASLWFLSRRHDRQSA